MKIRGTFVDYSVFLTELQKALGKRIIHNPSKQLILEFRLIDFKMMKELVDNHEIMSLLEKDSTESYYLPSCFHLSILSYAEGFGTTFQSEFSKEVYKKFCLLMTEKVHKVIQMDYFSKFPSFPLSCLPHLQGKTLLLSQMNSITNLEGCKQLRELQLVDCRGISNCSCLSNLQTLRIIRCGIRSLLGLGQIPNLSIIECPFISDLSPLTHTRSLRFIPSPGLTVSGWDSLCNLNSLVTTDIKVLGYLHLMTNLKQLDLTMDLTIRFTSFPRSLLRLTLCSSSYQISPFGLCGLQCVEFIDTKIKRLHSLENIPIVKLHSCLSLVDISCLGGNRFVSISNCPAILDFKCLKNIPKISLNPFLISLNPWNTTDIENVKDLEFCLTGTILNISELKCCERLVLKVDSDLQNLQSFDGIENVSEVILYNWIGSLSSLRRPVQNKKISFIYSLPGMVDSYYSHNEILNSYYTHYRADSYSNVYLVKNDEQLDSMNVQCNCILS